jgi:hypothetical protein
MDLRHEIDEKYNSNAWRKWRWEQTINWLFTDSFNDIQNSDGILDIGDRSGFSDLFEDRFHCYCTNTNIDLDNLTLTPHGSYGSIFAFEIIEHLMNPLLFLQWCKLNLEEGGVIYLSTPMNRWGWFKDRIHHFHEFERHELQALFDKAGLRILNEKIINPVPLRSIFTGFRPIFRYLIKRNILLKLRIK